MRRAGNRNRNAMGHGLIVPARGELVEQPVRPRFAGNLQKRTALLPALQRGLGATPQRVGILHQLVQLRGCTVHGGSTPGMNKQDRVDPAAAAAQNRIEVVQQAGQIRDRAGLHCPLQAVAVTERAGRIGRRAPRQQQVQPRIIMMVTRASSVAVTRAHSWL